MTKTIINGIDVSECNFRLEREGKQKCECTHATGFGVICDCENWHNCYYKQLKRLQKENEGLKKKQVTKNGFICDCEQNAKYKQALKEIRHFAALEAMLDKNLKAFYPANIQRILDVINEVLNDN